MRYSEQEKDFIDSIYQARSDISRQDLKELLRAYARKNYRPPHPELSISEPNQSLKFQQTKNLSGQNKTNQTQSAASGEGLVPDSLEYAALKAFYDSLNGPNWINNTNWLSGETSLDFSSWFGVEVVNNDVHSIQLLSNGLEGKIPDQFGQLTELVELILSRRTIDFITGIAPSFQNLDKLEILYLDSYSFESIPISFFCELDNLVVLEVAGNELSGDISPCIFENSKLKILNLTGNDFTNIPSNIGNAVSLEWLDLTGNINLSTNIPSSIGDLSKLRFFSCNICALYGEIPASIGNLQNLEDLRFYDNALSGNIPPEIGNVANLRNLGLAWNNFSGPVPLEVGNLSRLQYLDLGNNNLTEVPLSIGQLDSLVSLNLRNNVFGSLPLEISNMELLEILDVRSNQLSKIPSLENVANLKSINTGYNDIIYLPDLPLQLVELDVVENNLNFKSLETFFISPGTTNINFSYSPQDSLETFLGTDFSSVPNEAIWVPDSGQYSNYQWYKNDILISGANERIYTPSHNPTQPTNKYRCVITNDWVTDLTLHSKEIVFTTIGPPILSASPNQSCDSTSVTLTAVGDTTVAIIQWYDYYNGTTAISSGNTFDTPVLTQNTYYYATQTIDDVESPKAEILVKIGPDYEVPRDTTLCRGIPFEIYARGENTTITWTDLDSYDEPEFIGVIDSTKVFGYSITDGTCTAEGEIQITVIDNPMVALADSSMVACPGEEFTLEVVSEPGATYLWQPGGYTTSSITIIPTDEVEYTVTVTGENGCSSTETINVPYIISRIPDKVETVCVIDSTELVANPADSYLWSTGETTQSIWYKSELPVINDEVTVDLILDGCMVTQHFFVTAEPSCPRKPISFNARAISTSAIQLFFVEDRGTQTEYVIEKYDGNTYQYLTTLPVGSDDFLDTGLEPYTVYRYRIHAVDGSNVSDYGYASARTFYPDMNYIREISLTQPDVMDTIGIPLFPYANKHTSWTYLDGLGDEIQAVIERESPGGRDIIQPIYVDRYGRNSRQYLSYTNLAGEAGNYREEAETEVLQFYANPPVGVASTSFPYAEVSYDGSQRNRTVEAGSVGEEYQLDSDHTITYSYDVNNAFEALLWQPNAGLNQLSASQYFNQGLLTKITTVDPENLETISYTDPNGRQIMTKQRIGSEWAYTYFVYDVKGRLIYVLPPELIKQIFSTQVIPYTISSDLLDKFAFRSMYDDNDLKIMEKSPGVEPVFFIYDDWDRLTLSQDGNQRAKNQWSFVKYDKYDRGVMSGLFTDEIHTTRETMQAHVFNYYDGGNNHFVKPGSDLLGYTNESFPGGLSASDVLSASYYDNYDFLTSTNLSGTQFQLIDQLSSDVGFLEVPEVFARLKGMMTGSVSRIIGTSEFMASVNFYDDEGRVIQSVNENHVGGLDIISSQYDFSGKVVKLYSLQTVGTDSLTMLMEYEYDHGDRLVRGYHTLNSLDRVHLYTNVYNELGELMKKNLHGEGGSFKQSVDYSYGIKGWLESINKSGLQGSQETPDPKDLFKMELIYDRNLINPSN